MLFFLGEGGGQKMNLGKITGKIRKKIMKFEKGEGQNLNQNWL